jgi:hypothetical protein
MTKSEFYLKLNSIRVTEGYEFGYHCEEVNNLLKEFFKSNVCIPKGVNRHPYADVLHAFAEGQEIESKGNGYYGTWMDVKAFTMKEYRIKPSEPIYEWQYLQIRDGKAYVTNNFYTAYDEVALIEPDFWNSCPLVRIEKTKKVKQ